MSRLLPGVPAASRPTAPSGCRIRQRHRWRRGCAARLAILAIGALAAPSAAHARGDDWIVEATRHLAAGATTGATDGPTAGAPLAEAGRDGDRAWNPLPVLVGLMGGVLVVAIWWAFAGIDLRRRARALEDSGRALRQILVEKDSILDNALVGILLVEGQRLIACNRRFSQMVGYREGELRALDLTRVFSPWPDQWMPDTPLQGRNGGLSEGWLVDRGGRAIWVEVSVTTVDAPGNPRRHVFVVVDIDARKRAEDALRAGEDRFHAAFDSAVRGIGLLDPDGRIVELNPAAAAWLGLPSHSLPAIPVWQLPGVADDPAQALRVRRAFEQARAGRSQKLDVRYRQFDHSGQLVALSLRPIGGADGRAPYILAEAAEVTATRLARDALKALATEARHPAGTDVLAGLVAHACRALAMRRGFIAELTEGGCQAQIRAAWEDGRPGAGGSVSLSGSPLTELLAGADVFHADGVCRRFPLDPDIQRLQARAWWGVALRDAQGCPVGFFVVLSDQLHPARREARALLAILAGRATLELLRRRTEARLRTVASALEHSREGLCIADRDRRIVMANAASAALCGLTPAALEGRPLTGLGGDDYGQRAFGEVLDVADRLGSWQGELWIRRAGGGDKLPLWLSINRIRHGERDDYAVLFFDNTLRRQAERERLELEANLQQVQRMESVGHLAGGIAHDFNNILTVIGGFTSLIRQAAERRPGLLPGYLDEIALATRRARDLVARLLAFSRNERQAPEAIIIAPILQEAGKLLQASLPAGIELDVRLPSALPNVSIGPGQLHQVVMNLALNARDAVGERGRILISAARYRIDGLRTCDSCHRHFAGDFVALMVQDNGHGIAAELRAKIFDPFFTTKPVGQGSGLGLSVLHGVVHGAGGHLEVASAEGAGTTFRVLLPVVPEDDAGDATQAPAVAAGDLPRARIMLVDDDPAIVQYAAELLAGKGHTVCSFTDPRKALLALRDAPQETDLLVVDQSMPHLTGEDLAQASRLLRPDLPVILCTGFGEQIDSPRAAHLGIRQFLLKPLMADALLRAVREALLAPR